MYKLLLSLWLLLSTTLATASAQELQDSGQHAPQMEMETPATAAGVAVEKGDRPIQQNHREASIRSLEKLPNYGSLIVALGFNILGGHPEIMYMRSWRSRFFDIGLHYNIPLGYSRLTLAPGIGLSFERYDVKDTYMSIPNNHTEKISTALGVRHLDFSLEAKFNVNRKYPKEGFSIALGGKMGTLWKAFCTMRYKEDDAVKRVSQWENFGLNSLCFALQAKLGWRRFSLYYTHPLTTLFPERSGSPHRLGLCIDLL